MKRSLLILMVAGAALNTTAQTVTNDSVQLAATYANQVWYSLANDEQGNAPKNNWDIAFDMKGITSGIHINAVSGIMLWAYPKAAIAGWGGVIDTNGLSTWPARYNSDTSWAYGAMGNYADPNNAVDLDWGIYDMSSHVVTGDSFYIIKLQNGDYKKLAIEALASGTFTFKYANLDGSSPQTATIVKTNFTDKNFAYYSIQNNTALPAGREPNSNTWDLLFTQYTAYVPTAYTVTGVLQNRGVRAVKVSNLPNKGTYTDYSTQVFNSAINTIGYNWKSYDMANSVYKIKDSTVYFVKSLPGEIWKVIFTRFASATGVSVFSKQQLTTNSIRNINNDAVASMAIYPNPATAQNINVVYNFETATNNAVLNVYDVTGKVVFSDNLDNSIGMHNYHVPASLTAGTYIMSIQTDNGRLVQKLIVQ